MDFQIYSLTDCIRIDGGLVLWDRHSANISSHELVLYVSASNVSVMYSMNSWVNEPPTKTKKALKHAKPARQRWTNRLEAMKIRRTILNPLTHVKHANLCKEGSRESLALEIGSSLPARSQGQSNRWFAKLAARATATWVRPQVAQSMLSCMLQRCLLIRAARGRCQGRLSRVRDSRQNRQHT